MNLYYFSLMLFQKIVFTGKPGFWDQFTPPPIISTHGHLIDSLFYTTTMLLLFFIALVCIGIFGFSYLYRAKNHPVALYVHGTSRKHIAIVAGIGAMVFIMVDMRVTGISNRDYLGAFNNWPKETEDVLRVEVLGQQWAWNFRYAGKDKIFNTDDDVVTLNDLRLPINRKIVFQITAKDVVHSFSLPNTRMKVDAMPGKVSRMWVELNTPGTYEVVCAEMCGTFHYQMKAVMTVLNPADFESWLTEMEARAKYTTERNAPDIHWGWKWISN